MPLDILSYLLGQKSAGGGGGGSGVSILSGTASPAPGVGDSGQIYLQYAAVPQLPAGYTPLGGLVLTGSQYINTGVAGNTNDLAIEMLYKPSPLSLVEDIVFGADWSTTGYFLLIYNGMWRFHSKGVSADVGGMNTSSYNIISTTPNTLTVNGVTRTLGGTAANVNTDILIGYNSYQHGRYGHGTIKSLKMLSGANTIHNFYPALDSSDVPCMYDTVSGTPYYNAGSGSFGTVEYVENEIIRAYAKVNGAWQPLIGTNTHDITLRGV